MRPIRMLTTGPGERTRVLEQDNRRLADSLNYVMDNLATVKTEVYRFQPSPPSCSSYMLT